MTLGQEIRRSLNEGHITVEEIATELNLSTNDVNSIAAELSIGLPATFDEAEALVNWCLNSNKNPNCAVAREKQNYHQIPMTWDEEEYMLDKFVSNRLQEGEVAIGWEVCEEYDYHNYSDPEYFKTLEEAKASISILSKHDIYYIEPLTKEDVKTRLERIAKQQETLASESSTLLGFN